MNFKEEIFKAVQDIVNMAVVNSKVDRTFKTVIKRVVKHGYVITDQAGQERIVPCGIPNVELRVGQSVWVKEPMSDLRKLHICGVVGK